MRAGARRHGREVLAPDGLVGLGHARVGGQDEHHGLRLRNQVHRQLRLRANSVQAGRVQHHQPLLEQRVRHVDERVPPARHFHQALGVGGRVVVGLLVVPEAQRARLLHGHVQGFGDFFHHAGQLLGVVHVQIKARPFFGRHAPVGERLRLQARFNGQQAQARGHAGVPAQLGGAHGGAPGAGGHDAAAISGEKHGVDQLRLAARELGHESDGDFFGAQLVLHLLKALDGGIVQQVARAQPFGERAQAAGHGVAPDMVLVKLLVESGHRHRCGLAPGQLFAKRKLRDITCCLPPRSSVWRTPDAFPAPGQPPEPHPAHQTARTGAISLLYS